MSNLYIFTLEPIEKRYTGQWYNFWKKGFSSFANVVYIDGDYSDNTISAGRFLDINKTNIYKGQQITKVAKLFAEGQINNDDIFIFMDFWHPGVTALKYMIQLNGMNCKMYGYAHAGSYDPWDFLAQAGLGEWAKYDEIAWLRAFDGIFVATKFHKKLILKTFNKFVKANKIHVVGFPMDWEQEIFSRIPTADELINNSCMVLGKDNIVVFPNRLDKEKQPQVFNQLAKDNKDYRFIKTIEVTSTKTEYYRLMANAKVSFSASLQETYGIGAVEALLLWCIPLVPNRLSYVELYDKEFRYNDYKDACKKLKYFIENYNSPKLIKKMRKNRDRIIGLSLVAIPNMIKVIMRDIDETVDRKRKGR